MDYLNLRKDLQSDSLSSHLKSANNTNNGTSSNYQTSSIPVTQEEGDDGHVDLSNSSFGEKLAHFQETDRKNSLKGKKFPSSSTDREMIPYVKPTPTFEQEDLFNDKESEDYGSLTRRGGPGKHQSMSSLMPSTMNNALIPTG